MRRQHPRIRLLAPLFLSLVLLAPARAAEDDYVPVNRPLPSTALVVCPIDDHTYSQGTGFVIDRASRLLVTNRHVVLDKTEVFVCFPLVNDSGTAYTPREYYVKKAPRIRGKVLTTDPTHDLAMVQLASLPDTAVELPLASKSPKVGDPAHMVGNPGQSSKLWVFASGKVQSIDDRKITYHENGQKVAARLSEVSVDTKEGKGASGAPVVNSAGELIGVLSAGQDNKPFTVICVDVTEVRQFLVEAHRNLATQAMKERDYKNAVVFCSKAIRFDPKNAMAYNERGAALSFQDRFGEAISDYSAAIRLEPKSPRMYRNRGSAYFYQGQYEQAMDDCNEAIRLDPNYAMAYITRSKVFMKLNKTKEAEADYLKALQLDPSLK